VKCIFVIYIFVYLNRSAFFFTLFYYGIAGTLQVENMGISRKCYQ